MLIENYNTTSARDKNPGHALTMFRYEHRKIWEFGIFDEIGHLVLLHTNRGDAFRFSTIVYNPDDETVLQIASQILYEANLGAKFGNKPEKIKQQLLDDPETIFKHPSLVPGVI